MITEQYLKENFMEVCHYVVSPNESANDFYPKVTLPSDNGNGKSLDITSIIGHVKPSLNTLLAIDQAAFEAWRTNYYIEDRIKGKYHIFIDHLVEHHGMTHQEVMSWLKAE